MHCGRGKGQNLQLIGPFSIPQCIRQASVPDLRKRALSLAYSGGPSIAFFPGVIFPSRNFHFGRPKIILSGFYRKKVLCHPSLLCQWVTLTYLVAQLFLFLSLSLSFFFFFLFRWGLYFTGSLPTAADTADS